MSLSLSKNQLLAIAAHIQPSFQSFVDAFDVSKYPQSTYAELVSAFASPKIIEKKNISDALRWKFGHWKKANYPSAHKELIERVSRKWPNLSESELKNPALMFEALNSEFRFITVSFLTHLVHPTQIAIIDQHNFRSLNHLVKLVDANWKPKATPSNLQDLLDVSYFLSSLAQTKALSLNASEATLRDIDMFLMTYGKSLKPRRSRVV